MNAAYNSNTKLSMMGNSGPYPGIDRTSDSLKLPDNNQMNTQNPNFSMPNNQPPPEIYN